MKKIFLIPFLLFLFIVTSGQSEQHFKTQKRLICKYKWTHNEKYFQQFVKNWKNEVTEIPDSVVANWSPVSQNSYQVFQAILDSTHYLSQEFLLYYYSCLSDCFPYLKDTSYFMIPYEMSYDMLEIKMDSFNQDSIWFYLNKKSYNLKTLTFFKPHIENRKTLYLTEWYKNSIIKNPEILKKLNVYDYIFFKDKKNHIKKTIQIIETISEGSGKIVKSDTTFLVDKSLKYYGSYPLNVEITFDRTFTYAFVENMNDQNRLVLQKRDGIWYVISFNKNRKYIITRTIIDF